MARKPRYAVGDVGIFHVYNRGNNYQKIFHDDGDYRYFRHLVFKAKQKTGIRLHYYAWMPNHYHLLLEAIASGHLSEAMKIIDQKYSIWHKNKYGGQGQLWQGRFKNKLVTDEIHFAICASYIELNPVKDGICCHPSQYRWNSFRNHSLPNPDNKLIDFDHQYQSLGITTRQRRAAHVKNIECRMKFGTLNGYGQESAAVGFE